MALIGSHHNATNLFRVGDNARRMLFKSLSCAYLYRVGVLNEPPTHLLRGSNIDVGREFSPVLPAKLSPTIPSAGLRILSEYNIQSQKYQLLGSFGRFLGSDLHIYRNFSTGKSSKEVSRKGHLSVLLHFLENNAGLRCLLNCIHSERRIMIPTFAALLISSAVISAFPMVVGNFINNFTESNVESVPSLFWCFLTVLVAALASFVKSCLSVLASDRIGMRLRTDLFKSFLHKKVEFYDRNSSGKLSSVLANDVAVSSTVVDHLCVLLRSLITILAGATLSLSLAPVSLFAYTMAPVAGSLFLVFPLSKLVQRLTAQKMQRISALISHAEDRFSNVRTVKAYNAEDYEKSLLEERRRDIFKISLRTSMYTGLTNFIAVGAVGGLIILMVYSSASLILAGTMKVGEVTSLLMYSALVGGSVQSFTGSLGELRKCAGAAATAMQYLSESYMEERFEGPKSLLKLGFAPGIRFDNVSFSYPMRPEQLVLKGISFSLEPNKKLVVLGESGCGKTTILQLLMGFYRPNSGSIFLDGININNIDMRTLRTMNGLADQQSALFCDTIRSNVLYGTTSEKIGDSLNAKLERAYRMADSKQFIASLPDGDLTVVGQHGSCISGGQRQRLAIARLIMRECGVVLLDEATSAVDPESEERIIKNLRKALSGKTVVIVTHRMSLLALADIVMVMGRDGVIYQYGPKEIVLANPCEILSRMGA